MQVANILDTLNRFAPPSLAEEWDNIGLQVGSLEDYVTGILVSLDVTEAVLWEAVEHDVNCLITHHPLFFKSFMQLDDLQVPTRLGRLASQMGINIISFHTNLDATQKGLNDQLALKLGLTKLKPLIPATDRKFPKAGLGRIGSLAKTTLRALVKTCANQLGVPQLRYVGDLKHVIERVAVMTGSGGDYFNVARNAGAQVLITGDVKYHQALDALAQNIALIDVGHYSGEIMMVDLVTKQVKSFLRQKKSSLKVFATQAQSDPFSFWT